MSKDHDEDDGQIPEPLARLRKKLNAIKRLTACLKPKKIPNPLLQAARDAKSVGLIVDGVDIGDALAQAAKAVPSSLFDSEIIDCRCGRGWCEVHGTYDLGEQTEVSAYELLQQRPRGTRGGKRVNRRKKPAD